MVMVLRRPPFRTQEVKRTHSTIPGVLYENSQKRPAIFMFIGAISVVQMMFWSYLSWFAYKGLGSERLQERMQDTDEDDSKKKIITSTKWRLIASLLALATGGFFAYTANMLTYRTVIRLQLVHQRNSLLFTTYTPWGSTRVIDAPLSRIHSIGNRLDGGGQVAVKVKGYPLFFLIDKKGQFIDPRLFDSLIVSRTRL